MLCLSSKTGLAMAFELMMSAQTKWRKLDGANRMPEIIEAIAFKDGIKQLNHAAGSRRHQLSGIAPVQLSPVAKDTFWLVGTNSRQLFPSQVIN
jgi:hypothetical protein